MSITMECWTAEQGWEQVVDQHRGLITQFRQSSWKLQAKSI